METNGPRIPKVIHYCWFGRGKKGRLAKRCIKSWKKYCPDYQIVEWNEDNYDVDAAPLYVRQALQAKKYAFASDYVRLQKVYEYGGIYLDVDVELIKNLDPFLNNRCYFGFEAKPYVGSGLGFGAEKGTPLLEDLMIPYRSATFINEDGSYNLTWNVQWSENVFLKHGLVPDGSEQILQGGVHIYPKEFFCPFSRNDDLPVKTKDTVSIHWYASSWNTSEGLKELKKLKRRHKLRRLYKTPNILVMKILGNERYEKLKVFLRSFRLSRFFKRS